MALGQEGRNLCAINALHRAEKDADDRFKQDAWKGLQLSCDRLANTTSQVSTADDRHDKAKERFEHAAELCKNLRQKKAELKTGISEYQHRCSAHNMLDSQQLVEKVIMYENGMHKMRNRFSLAMRISSGPRMPAW